jgi:hypothetical protein
LSKCYIWSQRSTACTTERLKGGYNAKRVSLNTYKLIEKAKPQLTATLTGSLSSVKRIKELSSLYLTSTNEEGISTQARPWWGNLACS